MTAPTTGRWRSSPSVRVCRTTITRSPAPIDTRCGGGSPISAGGCWPFSPRPGSYGISACPIARPSTTGCDATDQVRHLPGRAGRHVEHLPQVQTGCHRRAADAGKAAGVAGDGIGPPSEMSRSGDRYGQAVRRVRSGLSRRRAGIRCAGEGRRAPAVARNPFRPRHDRRSRPLSRPRATTPELISVMAQSTIPLTPDPRFTEFIEKSGAIEGQKLLAAIPREYMKPSVARGFAGLVISAALYVGAVIGIAVLDRWYLIVPLIFVAGLGGWGMHCVGHD